MLLSLNSGLGFMLISSTLPIWLARLGFSNTLIGGMFLTTLPYCAKPLIAPLTDRYAIPYFSKKLGQRRGWIMLLQLLLIMAVGILGVTSPKDNLIATISAALLIASISATLDATLDAYRIESSKTTNLAIATAMTGLGFRLGMIGGGAGSLYLAANFNWPIAFFGPACAMFIGPIAIILLKESAPLASNNLPSISQYSRFVINGIKAFFVNHPWYLIIPFIFLYKASDAIPHAMSGPFLVELGFDNQEIAYVSKTFGLIVMMLGVILGGVIVSKTGLLRGLLVCGLIQLLSPLTFMLLANHGHNLQMLILAVTIQNLSSGMGNIAFVTYLSSLCSKDNTATQFAIIYSFSSLSRIILSAASGRLADIISWDALFYYVTLLSSGFIIIIFLLKLKGKNKAI